MFASKLIPRRGDVTVEMIAAAEQRAVDSGRSLAALTAFTETLLEAYQRGRMPEASRVAFKGAVQRLYRGADRDDAVTPLAIRASKPELEATRRRTEALIAKHEKEIARLEARFDATSAEIDRVQATAEALVRNKERLLVETGVQKDRSRTASAVSALAGFVPGAQLAKLALFIPGAGPLALLAFGFGGYHAYKNWQHADQLAGEMKVLDRQIAGAQESLRALKHARSVYDANIGQLEKCLATLVEGEKSYRERIASPPPVTGGDRVLQAARMLRATEALAFNLQQQIGVWTSMNEHADGMKERLPELVRALEREVGEAKAAAREAEAELISSVIATVLGSAKIKGIGAQAIKEAVLYLKIGVEVTVVEKIRRTLQQLGIAEVKQPALVKSADELMRGIEKLTADRAQILDPAHDRLLAELSEPQQFLVDVALSELNTKIDPAVLIAFAKETAVSDADARKIAALIAGRSSARDVARAVEELRA